MFGLDCRLGCDRVAAALWFFLPWQSWQSWQTPASWNNNHKKRHTFVCLYQNVCAAWLLHQPFNIQQRLVVELFNLVWNPLQRHNKFSKLWNIFQTLCNNCANLKRISTSSKQNEGVLVDIVSLCQCSFLPGFCAGRAQEVIGSKNSDFYMSMYRSDFFVFEKHKILKLASRCGKSGFSENS